MGKNGNNNKQLTRGQRINESHRKQRERLARRKAKSLDTPPSAEAAKDQTPVARKTSTPDAKAKAQRQRQPQPKEGTESILTSSITNLATSFFDTATKAIQKGVDDFTRGFNDARQGKVANQASSDVVEVVEDKKPVEILQGASDSNMRVNLEIRDDGSVSSKKDRPEIEPVNQQPKKLSADHFTQELQAIGKTLAVFLQEYLDPDHSDDADINNAIKNSVEVQQVKAAAREDIKSQCITLLTELQQEGTTKLQERILFDRVKGFTNFLEDPALKKGNFAGVREELIENNLANEKKNIEAELNRYAFDLYKESQLTELKASRNKIQAALSTLIENAKQARSSILAARNVVLELSANSLLQDDQGQEEAYQVYMHDTLTILEKVPNKAKPEDLLIKHVKMLSNEMDEMMKQPSPEQKSTVENDVLQVAKELNQMVKTVVDTTVSMQTKVESIDHYSQCIANATSFAQPKWKKALKLAACVGIAAVGVVAGAIVGGIIEGAILAVISAPAFGSLGVIGAIHGAIQGAGLGIALAGSVTGAVGLGAFGVGATGFGLFGKNAAMPLQKISDDAKDLVKAQSALAPSAPGAA